MHALHSRWSQCLPRDGSFMEAAWCWEASDCDVDEPMDDEDEFNNDEDDSSKKGDEQQWHFATDWRCFNCSMIRMTSLWLELTMNNQGVPPYSAAETVGTKMRKKWWERERISKFLDDVGAKWENEWWQCVILTLSASSCLMASDCRIRITLAGSRKQSLIDFLIVWTRST